MPTKEPIVIDVPSIIPQLKHKTIFEEFEKLQAGESLIIHNDHDPKPVYYQLQVTYGDVFTWEYLQQGPDIWNILVTLKKEEQKAPEPTEEELYQAAIEGAIVREGNTITVTAPKIQPRFKHDAILNTFNNLKEGESMIIHNDHDPIPLYYQMKNLHGETFSWDYDQDGPEWWDVRVAKL